MTLMWLHWSCSVNWPCCAEHKMMLIMEPLFKMEPGRTQTWLRCQKSQLSSLEKKNFAFFWFIVVTNAVRWYNWTYFNRNTLHKTFLLWPERVIPWTEMFHCGRLGAAVRRTLGAGPCVWDGCSSPMAARPTYGPLLSQKCDGVGGFGIDLGTVLMGVCVS